MTDIGYGALKGRIAVIGWGSLIWDLDNLAHLITGDWMMGAGPSLPFEFTRVSPKRKMGLAVCPDVRVVNARISPMLWFPGSAPVLLFPTALLGTLDLSPTAQWSTPARPRAVAGG